MGDFNAHLGNMGGSRGFGNVDNRGEKLIEFLDYFNLLVLNLSETTCGPVHTFMSDDERHKSVIDFIIVLATFISKFLVKSVSGNVTCCLTMFQFRHR